MEKMNPGIDELWINPIGGLGDTLMLSGVLKQVIERHPERRFRLVRRPGYMSILNGHPAIAGVGFPKNGAKIITTDYWSREPLGPGRQRPMQILARMFGLGEVEERFYVAGEDDGDGLLNLIPWGPRNIVIAPGSASPRKEWSHRNWQDLVWRLRGAGFFVVHLGNAGGRNVRSAYSLLGLTQPKQVFPLLRRADLIVTVDCFLMHAAHYMNRPAVVLWGPTCPEVYGYPRQFHLHAGTTCAKPDGCLSPGKGENYGSPCPSDPEHCVDAITVEQVYSAIQETLGPLEPSDVPLYLTSLFI
jgi:ADP-heptose:LPS heptosyltransferase